uniref:Uncharacterized protein n=1 Tax=Cacopsylla melanoneura TaxID=428564 RepID=A0A8D8LYM3_9HEMI
MHRSINTRQQDIRDPTQKHNMTTAMNKYIKHQQTQMMIQRQTMTWAMRGYTTVLNQDKPPMLRITMMWDMNKYTKPMQVITNQTMTSDMRRYTGKMSMRVKQYLTMMIMIQTMRN